MVIGTCRIELSLPESSSLKDKRRVIVSLLERMRHKFNVSAAEVDGQDLWQRAVIGVAMVSNETRHCSEVLSRVVRWIESSGEALLVDYQVEIL